LLKISMEQEKDQTLLRIEGKLIDPWTKELEATWQDLATKLAGKRLFVDICAATFIDQRGVELLHKIVRLSNASLLADSPLTRQFARKIRHFGTDQEGKKS
jgi:hypothetical protein